MITQICSTQLTQGAIDYWYLQYLRNILNNKWIFKLKSLKTFSTLQYLHHLDAVHLSRLIFNVVLTHWCVQCIHFIMLGQYQNEVLREKTSKFMKEELKTFRIRLFRHNYPKIDLAKPWCIELQCSKDRLDETVVSCLGETVVSRTPVFHSHSFEPHQPNERCLFERDTK